MKPTIRLIVFTWLLMLFACREPGKKPLTLTLGEGHMPQLAIDGQGNLHVIYGKQDSIMYTSSADKGGHFSPPIAIACIPGLVAGSMRGPQLAATGSGLVVIAATKSGDIFCTHQSGKAHWSAVTRVNDTDAVAKEGFMALGADGEQVFTVWLDLRSGHNAIAGAASCDNGNTWSKNSLVYASPDTTVCECCKPSVAVKANGVYVMFRNHLKGNRDMFWTHSADKGKSFSAAEQLGKEHWALNACPMDGGAMAIAADGSAQTVWRRRSMIYTCKPGGPETAIAEGKGPAIATFNGKNSYAWTAKGYIIIRKPNGTEESPGKGQLPQLCPINQESILCVWENDNQVQAAIISL